MATLTPLIYGPDGQLREAVVFSTTQGSRFLSGTMDADTVDMEVSVRGGAFSNNADLILFEGTQWYLPNPAVYPDGLDLTPGLNAVQVRSILSSGAETSVAQATINLVQDSGQGVLTQTPTGVSVDKLDASVRIHITGFSNTTGFQGYNIYASVYPGGGTTGYQRINLDTISSGSYSEVVSSVYTTSVDSDVPLDGNGLPTVDPMYYQLVGQQVDSNGALVQQDFDGTVVLAETVRTIRTTYTVEDVQSIQTYSFEHSRSAGPTSSPATIYGSAFASLATTDPLYYVVTAVFLDSTTNTEFESAFSQEVVGHPLRVTATIGTFPRVARKAIVEDYIASVYRSNPQVRVDPGSSLREQVIDPFSMEAERVRFLLDFLHRAGSPALLLAVDDPEGTGVSAPVSTTAYKQALKKAFLLNSNAEVQALIDSCFDSYASNFGVYRDPSRSAQGEVVFYTTTRPTRTLQIPLGTLVGAFRTTRAASIPLNQLASYYDPTTGWYRVTVPVKAVTAGSAGNVGVGQIRTIQPAIPGLSVTNFSKMSWGKDQDTNLQLMERAKNRLSSVDTGTVQGLLQVAANVPGVVKANVVGAGNPLMQRDLDATGVHRGGKVDVWVQGSNTTTVTDTFAFSFQLAQDIQFVLIGDPADLQFMALDHELSESNPIVEILDYPDSGYLLKNASTGEVFDTTGVVLLSYNTIQLDTTLAQPAVDLTDVVLGSYRRRLGSTFVLPRQPVATITSVVGVVSGTLPTTAFALYHPDAPLDKGRSTLAQDYLQISSYTDSTGATVPSGAMVSVVSESHVLVGEYPEYLNSLGASFLTMRVFNADRTVEYRGPNDPSGVSDFTITQGTQTTAVSIQRTLTGVIASGDTVLIDYAHDENFTVTYTTNLVVSNVQNALEAVRHATADVVVKDAVPVPINLHGTLVLNKGQDPAVVDTAVRTNLSNFVQELRLGDPIRQSDVIHIFEATAGVSYVTVPLALMARGTGSQVVREALNTSLVNTVVGLTSLSTAAVQVWLLKDPLVAATTDGGGPDTSYRGVFQDSVALSLLASTATFTSLGLLAGRAYIVGSGGAVLMGYSDDATLIAAGFVDSTARLTERLNRTANRVLVSLVAGDTPVNHTYACTYVVGTDTGAKNIAPGAAEYIVLGDFVPTYEEDV